MADWHNNQYSTIHSLGFFEEIKGRIEENHNDFLNSQQQKCMNKGENFEPTKTDWIYIKRAIRYNEKQQSNGK